MVFLQVKVRKLLNLFKLFSFSRKPRFFAIWGLTHHSSESRSVGDRTLAHTALLLRMPAKERVNEWVRVFGVRKKSLRFGLPCRSSATQSTDFPTRCLFFN